MSGADLTIILVVVFLGALGLFGLWQDGRRQHRKRQAENQRLDAQAKHR
jgi:hypothetical protein